MRTKEATYTDGYRVGYSEGRDIATEGLRARALNHALYVARGTGEDATDTLRRTEEFRKYLLGDSE